MAPNQVKRKLAAILAADIAGYSRLMGADEAGTLARLKEYRRELIDPKNKQYRCRIVKTTGTVFSLNFRASWMLYLARSRSRRACANAMAMFLWRNA